MPTVSIGQIIVSMLTEKVLIPQTSKTLPLTFRVPFSPNDSPIADPQNGLLIYDRGTDFIQPRRPTMTVAGDLDIPPDSFNPQTGTAIGHYYIISDELRDPLTVTWAVDEQPISATGKSVTLTFTLTPEEQQRSVVLRHLVVTATDADNLSPPPAKVVVSIHTGKASCKELLDKRSRLQTQFQHAHTDAQRQQILDQITDVNAQITAQGCT